MPYAGAVRALGRTPSEVRSEDIVRAIGNRAIEPQVVVALITQNTSLISVLGEVNLPNRFPANAAGERVLDAITRAEVPKELATRLKPLERGGKRATVPFGALVFAPANNIWVHPGDTIYVYREPQASRLRASTAGQFPFEMWKTAPAQAMAKAGGLLDAQVVSWQAFMFTVANLVNWPSASEWIARFGP